MVPDEFVGAWRRVSIALDGGEPHEPEDVLWLQTHESFADLRIPKDPSASEPEAFAGTTTYEPALLRWHHELDWHGAFADTDHGDVSWRDGDLIERGEMTVDGQVIAYEEVWRRDPDPANGALALLALDGVSVTGRLLLVRVGDHVLVLADSRPDRGFAAMHGTLATGTWTPGPSPLGEPDLLGELPPLDPTSWPAGAAHTITDVVWTVREAGYL